MLFFQEKRQKTAFFSKVLYKTPLYIFSPLLFFLSFPTRVEIEKSANKLKEADFFDFFGSPLQKIR